MEDSKKYIRKEEDCMETCNGEPCPHGRECEPHPDDLSDKVRKESIIPVIQRLDKKVHPGWLTLYGFDYLNGLSYAQLEELRDKLVREYNEALAEEDRANGETVRLNGLSGEFQAVDKRIIETNPDYWDCECDDKDYIHKKTEQKHCAKCDTSHEEQPDSRQEEVDVMHQEESHEANHLLCQIVIASASGFLGDPAKRKTEIIVKAAEYLDRIHYQFQHNHKEEN